MSDFAKYREIKTRGATPREIYLAAKADGVDEISAIRLLRSVCVLSLAEAKRATGAPDVFDQKQEVRVGNTVYWDGADTVDGFYLKEGRVDRVEGEKVFIAVKKKYLITGDGPREVPVAEQGLIEAPLRYFDKTLTERLGESLQFWEGLAQLNGKPAQLKAPEATPKSTSGK